MSSFDYSFRFFIRRFSFFFFFFYPPRLLSSHEWARAQSDDTTKCSCCYLIVIRTTLTRYRYYVVWCLWSVVIWHFLAGGIARFTKCIYCISLFTMFICTCNITWSSNGNFHIVIDIFVYFFKKIMRLTEQVRVWLYLTYLQVESVRKFKMTPTQWQTPCVIN
jgi:hypothetical protein